MDANPSVPLTATINWGDGSPSTVIDLPVGSYAFSAPHDYTAFPASGFYTIGVTLVDPYGESAFAQTTVALGNPAPSFAAPGLVLSSTSIVEGGTVERKRNNQDPGRGRHQFGHAQLGRRLRADHDHTPGWPETLLDYPYVLEQSRRSSIPELYGRRFGDQPGWPGRVCVGDRHREQGCPPDHRGRPGLVGDDRERGRHDHARRPVQRPGRTELIHRVD